MYQISQKDKKREGKLMKKNIAKQSQISKLSNIGTKRIQMKLKRVDTGAVTLQSHN